MRPDRRDTCTLGRRPRDEDNPVAGQAPVRIMRVQEDLPRRRRGSPVPEVVGQCRADITGQRHRDVMAALAMDQQHPGVPVQVVQAHARDLVRAEPEPQHQGQDRVVAKTGRRRSVAAVQQRVHGLVGQQDRQARCTGHAQPRNRPGQVGAMPAGRVGVAQEAAQVIEDVRQRARCQPPRLVQNERMHELDSDLLDQQLPVRLDEGAGEPATDVPVALDRQRCQPASFPQIGAVVVQQPTHRRRLANRSCPRDSHEPSSDEILRRASARRPQQPRAIPPRAQP
jgi:hypothetical protein